MARIVVLEDDPARCPETLVEVLRECQRLCAVLLQALIKEPDRFRSVEHLWRWGILYAVLLEDIVGALAEIVASGAHNRAALILRRSVFEYFVRFRYYARNTDQARIAMEHATPRLRLFIDSIWDDPEAELIEDPSFDPQTHESESHVFTNFESVVRAVFEYKDAQRLYGRYYRFPSPLAHGYAEACCDVLNVVDGTNVIYRKSRRPNAEIALNAADFAAEFARDANERLGLGLAGEVEAVLLKKAQAAASCGIDMVFYRVRT